MKYYLSGYHFRDLEVGSWAEIEENICQLHPVERCFYTLSRSNEESYVQFAGARRRLTVEARIYRDNGEFKHFRLGRIDGEEGRAYINCRIGPIHLSKHQVMNLKEATEIFRRFYEGEDFFEGFTSEEIEVEVPDS